MIPIFSAEVSTKSIFLQVIGMSLALFFSIGGMLLALHSYLKRTRDLEGTEDFPSSYSQETREDNAKRGRITVKVLVVLSLFIISLVTFGTVITRAERSGPIVIGFLVKDLNNEHFKEMERGAKLAAKKYKVHLLWSGAESERDYQQMIEKAETWLKGRKVDALCITPVNTETTLPVLQLANQYNIPVVIVDTPLKDEMLGDLKYSIFIGSDNYLGGKLAASYMAQKLKAMYYEQVRRGEKLKVGIITITEGLEPGELRARGFLEEIKKYPYIEFTDVAPGYAERSGGAKAMKSLLQQYPDLKGVFAVNGPMTLGAADALQEFILATSRKPPESRGEELRDVLGAEFSAITPQYEYQKRIVLVGFDKTKEIEEAILQRRIDATVTQEPFSMGMKAVKYAKMLVIGQQPKEKIIYTPIVVLARERFFIAGGASKRIEEMTLLWGIIVPGSILLLSVGLTWWLFLYFSRQLEKREG